MAYEAEESTGKFGAFLNGIKESLASKKEKKEKDKKDKKDKK